MHTSLYSYNGAVTGYVLLVLVCFQCIINPAVFSYTTTLFASTFVASAIFARDVLLYGLCAKCHGFHVVSPFEARLLLFFHCAVFRADS